MNEKFQATDANALSPEKELVAKQLLGNSKFTVSELGEEFPNYNIENKNADPDSVANKIIDSDALDNAGLIKKRGDSPTVPGIEVVETISKLNMNTDALRSAPTVATKPNMAQIRLDKRLDPSVREEERAKAREAAKARPWWKKIIGG